VDPHCFDADPESEPDPAQNLDADPDPDPGGGGGAGGVGQPKMCIPPGKILGTPLCGTIMIFCGSGSYFGKGLEPIRVWFQFRIQTYLAQFFNNKIFVPNLAYSMLS
jgi:hypothetical protein